MSLMRCSIAHRDAQTLLKNLQRAPAGVKALPTILSEYVALTEADMRRKALAQRNPLLRDMLAVLDRHAAATTPAALATLAGPRPQPSAPAPQLAARSHPGAEAGSRPAGSQPAAQRPQPAPGSQRLPPEGHAQLRGAAALANAGAGGRGTSGAAMRMVPTPAAAAGPQMHAGGIGQAPAGQSTPRRPAAQPLGRAGNDASPGQHGSRKRLPARRKRPAPEPELDATGQDGGLADALGILERTMNPESLLSLFSGGELQVRKLLTQSCFGI